MYPKKTTDWIPSNEKDLVSLVKKWVETFGDQTKAGVYEWKQADCAEKAAILNAFLTALSKYEGVRTPENRNEKDKTKKAAVSMMRKFANSSIRYNEKMSESDRLVLGIHPKDTTQTSHEAPKSQPNTVVENTSVHYQHKVLAAPSVGSGKPSDAYGVRYAWQIGGERPANGEDLPKNHFTRKTSYLVTHKEEHKGKTGYYATCYENSRGDLGPWSPIVEALIS